MIAPIRPLSIRPWILTRHVSMPSGRTGLVIGVRIVHTRPRRIGLTRRPRLCQKMIIGHGWRWRGVLLLRVVRRGVIRWGREVQMGVRVVSRLWIATFRIQRSFPQGATGTDGGVAMGKMVLAVMGVIGGTAGAKTLLLVLLWSLPHLPETIKLH